MAILNIRPMLLGVPRLIPGRTPAKREVFGEPDVFVRERPAFARFIDRCHPKDITVGTIADQELDKGQALWSVSPENLFEFVDCAQGNYIHAPLQNVRQLPLAIMRMSPSWNINSVAPESKPPPAGLPGAA